jgi:gas vesicle protein
VSLLLLLVVVGAAAAAYVVISDASQRGVQLREQVQGDAQQSVDELKQLIEDNVR